MLKEYKTLIDGKPVTIVEVEYRWYTLKELANLVYKVDKSTLRKRLQMYKKEIGPRIGYFYDVKQVKIIFQLLPPPYKVVFSGEIKEPDENQ